MKTTQEMLKAERSQWQLIPYRNVKRCIVGKFWMHPDHVPTSDRLVDNRVSFRAKLQPNEPK